MKRTNSGEEEARMACLLSLRENKKKSEGTDYGRDENQGRNETIKGSEGQRCTQRLEAWEDGEDGDFGIPSTQPDGTPVSQH